MRSFTAMKPHRVAALFMVALALAACGVAGTRVSPSGRPTAAPGAPKLVIRLDTGNDERGVGQHDADYLSDGTIIRYTVVGSVCQRGQPCGTMERNTLTATGLAALRALLAQDADLLANPLTLTPQRSPGIALRGGYRTYAFVLERSDGTRYTVNAPSTSWRSSDPSAPDPATWVRDPAIERLNALAAALVDPATVVGASGLADPTWAPYQPVQMAVFVSLGEVDPQFVAEGLAPDIATTGWLFQDAPDALGEAFHGRGYQRCAFLPAADVLLAITSLPSRVGSTLASGELAAGSTWHSGTLLWAAKGPTTALGLNVVALLPEDAVASCADALAY
jgi:hypothetical protein